MSPSRPTWPLVLTLAAVLLVGCSPSPVASPAPTTAASVPAEASPVQTTPAAPAFGSCARRWRHWWRVLTALDERRARAYTLARPRLLGDVYVAGSAVLRRDRATLLAWSARRVAVTDLHLDLLALEILHADRRLVRLRVVDRLTRATARLPQGRAVNLPRDEATARILGLRKLAGQWRIATSWHAPG